MLHSILLVLIRQPAERLVAVLERRWITAHYLCRGVAGLWLMDEALMAIFSLICAAVFTKGAAP